MYTNKLYFSFLKIQATPLLLSHKMSQDLGNTAVVSGRFVTVAPSRLFKMFRLFALVCFGVTCDTIPTRHFRMPVNDRPIIGILTQEVDETVMQPFGNTYIPATYVKYLESGGSRVVPIRLNQSEAEYEKIFKSINGMLYIGGAVNLVTSDYAKAARIFFQLALKANKMGDYFPLWGTCMGFQLLTVMVAGENLLSSTTAENLALPLNLTEEAHSSHMFKDFPAKLLKAISHEPLTGNFHHYGVTETAFRGDEKLSQFFSILSTNVAENGAVFVSTMEGKRYPFYGVQWHPEVNRFQWHPKKQFPHSSNAVRVSSLLAEFFVNEARKSSHHFDSPEEEASALIYNYTPVYTANVTSYEQCYFF